MFFIPFYRKVDWSNPPLITILLILVNCLVFILFQSRDDEYTETAYQFYLESELPDIEIPLYLQYLEEQGRFKKIESYKPYMDRGGEFRLAVVVPMQQDSQFMQQVENGSLFADKEKHTTWQALHNQFQTKLHKAIWYSYGLKPNEPSIITFVTNIFLHGSWGHLIGNMVFLFIIGFVVESALGKSSYLSGYLIAGLCGSVLYVLFNSSSQTATVGASGAIAGLMGMYTLLFGLRKINFFYFVFVYFDYVKAPAIVLFPIWLGHEIVQLLMQSDQGVNYYAHIGGLVSGAVFIVVSKKYFKNINLEYLDQNDIEDEQKNRFEDGMELLAQMKNQEATAVFRSLVNDFPDNQEYLLQWYNAAKRLPASDDFHAAARKVMMIPTKNQQTYKLIFTTYNDYMKLAQPKPKLNTQLLQHLMTPLALGGFLQDAEKLLVLLKRSKHKEQVAEATLVLANAFHKANDNKKYKHYLTLITTEFPQTPTAHEASQRLLWLNQTG